jgi:hypothetical protein
MNVLIIEAGGSHFECVHSMVHYLHMKNDRVFLACNKKLLASVTEPEKISALLELPDDPTNKQHLRIAFILRRFIHKHSIEAVIFNTTEITIVRNLLTLLPRLNYTGIVHNAKRLEKSFTFTRIISRKMKKFFVLSDYLVSKLHAYEQFRIESFYPVYFPPVKSLSPVKPPGECWITIPGEVFTNRRDYLALIKEVEECDQLPDNIKFILLGYNHLDEETNRLLKSSEKLKTHFITFDHYLDYDLFHSYIQQSDFILPLLKTEEGSFYGTGRISGSFNLGIGYHLPFLLPVSYRENQDIAPYSLYYNSIQELLPLITQKEKNQLVRKQLSEVYNSGKFSNSELQAEKIHSFITS